jgi:hypothetical protein
MTMTSRVFRLWGACLSVALALSSQATLIAQEAQQPQEFIEAERLIAAGNWDQTVVILTQLIQRLESAPRDAGSVRVLVAAYEKRALARLQTGDRTNATIDFVALLQLDPNYAFAAPSPGIMSLFTEARKSAVASVELTLRPNDATVALEKMGSPGANTPPAPTQMRIGTQWLAPGSYRMTIRQPGYDTRIEEFELRPGMVHQLPIDLKRTSTVLLIRTVPSGVNVRVDGEVRGTTQPAPDGGGRSELLLIDGLVPRAMPYRVRLEKGCFVSAASEFVVPAIESWKGPATPDALWDPDRSYDPVELKPAFGTLAVSADQPGATILIDGERRGQAGQPIADVCEGDHSVEVRSPTGQFSQRVKVEFGKESRLQARLVPTYGIVRAGERTGTAGAQADIPGVVQALQTDNLKLVPVDLAEKEVALLASATGEELRRATDLLSQRLDIQGVATVARVAADAEGRDLELRLFVRGSSKPDILRFSVQGSSAQRAVASLNPQISVVRPTIGLDAVDVMRLEGAVVASVDPKGPSAGVIVPGDVIVGMGVASIGNVGDLIAALEKAPDARVNIRLRDKPAPVSVVIQRRPDLVSVYDSRPFNIMITELNAQLARQRMRESPSADEQRFAQALRLNLGAALIAIGNCPAAQQTLSEVRLESGRGISQATVDYLRAVCYKQMGQVAEARALFEAASQSQDALLTEHGPAISYLARVELLTLGSAAQK